MDRVVHRCRQFHGCRVLVQIWLAAHLEMDLLRPQRHAIEIYCNSGHARTIKSVPEEYQMLSELMDDAMTWRIIPSAAEPFTVFFDARDTRLVVLPGFTGGEEYHPIWVMRQFGYRQGTFIDSTVPRLMQTYQLITAASTTVLVDLM